MTVTTAMSTRARKSPRRLLEPGLRLGDPVRGLGVTGTASRRREVERAPVRGPGVAGGVVRRERLGEHELVVGGSRERRLPRSAPRRAPASGSPGPTGHAGARSSTSASTRCGPPASSAGAARSRDGAARPCGRARPGRSTGARAPAGRARWRAGSRTRPLRGARRWHHWPSSTSCSASVPRDDAALVLDAVGSSRASRRAARRSGARRRRGVEVQRLRALRLAGLGMLLPREVRFPDELARAAALGVPGGELADGARLVERRGAGAEHRSRTRQSRFMELAPP